jgi:dynein heavy chain
MEVFIANTLGSKFNKEDPINFTELLNETKPEEPLLLFTDVDRILPHIKHDIVTRCGQGLGEGILKGLSTAAKLGQVIIVGDCHLAPSFQNKLSSEITSIVNSGTLHKDFRCILTSMPFDGISSFVPFAPRICIEDVNKFGFKSSMLNNYEKYDDKHFDAQKRSQEFKGLFFGVSTYHSLFQGRLKYVPHGFTRSYGLNSSHFKTSIRFIERVLTQQDDISYDEMKYILSEIIYGGIVTEGWDRRLNQRLANYFFTDDFLMKPQAKYIPGFQSPDPNEMNRSDYVEYIEAYAPDDAPEVYGLSCYKIEGTFISHLSNNLYFVKC